MRRVVHAFWPLVLGIIGYGLLAGWLLPLVFETPAARMSVAFMGGIGVGVVLSIVTVERWDGP